MNNYLAIIKETFPELNIQDFSVLGHGNLATACLVNKNIVFKITNTSEKATHDTEREIYLLKLINHNLSFNVPKIICDGKINNGGWVFGESLLPGTTYSKELHASFDKDTQIDILRQIGRIMHELHSIKVNDDKKLLFVGDYKQNIAMFNEYFSDEVKQYFSPADIERINAVHERYEHLSTHYPVELVLVHADMHFGNFMFDTNTKKITGLIDFGAAHFAEPARDMHYYYGEDIKHILEGYGETKDSYLPERQKFHSVTNFLENIGGYIQENISPNSEIQKLLNIL